MAAYIGVVVLCSARTLVSGSNPYRILAKGQYTVMLVLCNPTYLAS